MQDFTSCAGMNIGCEESFREREIFSGAGKLDAD
jgi:hypothetical protein